MALDPGTRLGPYEITTRIGAGGMGEVYRAIDTKLKRQVAIKVLPASVAGDPEQLARFQREAEVLAQLNHPNIAAIHGLEEADGLKALVMELVEGPTLADLIAGAATGGRESTPEAGGMASVRSARGGGAPRGLPIDEALPIAHQIAEALEAAHEQGIIHRDLKPANVKVRPDGTVKVLDFGLAKPVEQTAGSSSSQSMSPTITTPAMTQAGVILGTAAYMSPEQAKGRTVDKRTDIWAFGAVLYEMLTGIRAFDREDVTETLADVMRVDPDWSRLPPQLSPTLVAFLRRCLHKDAKQRIPDMAAMRLVLDGAFETSANAHAHVVALTPPPLWRRFGLSAVIIALAVAVLTLGAAAYLYRMTSSGSAVLRFAFTAPRGLQLPDSGGVAFSPDGSRLVYQARDEQGVTRLYVRALDSFDARPIDGTEGGTQPFFSPNGEWIGFFADRKLKKCCLLAVRRSSSATRRVQEAGAGARTIPSCSRRPSPRGFRECHRRGARRSR